MKTGAQVKILHASESQTIIVPYTNSPYIPSPLFTCEILNADNVYFGYKKHSNGRWNKKLPNFFNVSNRTMKSQNDIEDIARHAFDYNKSDTSVDILKEMNGYYRCVGNNTLGPYLTYSPVIKLIFPCEYLSLSNTQAVWRF